MMGLAKKVAAARASGNPTFARPRSPFPFSASSFFLHERPELGTTLSHKRFNKTFRAKDTALVNRYRSTDYNFPYAVAWRLHRLNSPSAFFISTPLPFLL
jgi:hypothetical protein